MAKANRLFVIFLLTVVVAHWSSNAVAADKATIAIKTPLKSSASLLGGKVLRDIEPGTLVTVLSTKSTYSQVELVDDPSVKGWVLTASISRNKDVAAGISNMNSASKGVSDTKAAIAGSMGGVAKGFAEMSPQAQAAAASGKGKAASIKEGIGAAAKGKPKAMVDEALEDAAGDVAGDAASDVMNAAADAKAKFSGKSASALEKIEALKVTESELSSFMKEGGLRSRLIR